MSNDALVSRRRCVIVGGGIAGASTAFHLARRGWKDILLLERELIPAFHASGRNAAIARQITETDAVTRLAQAGTTRLNEAGLLRPTGGHLLARNGAALEVLQARARTWGISAELREGPGLPGLVAQARLVCPDDGVIDIHGQIQTLLAGAREAGVEMRFGCSVRGVEPLTSGYRLLTDQGVVDTDLLVNAAGAWAGPLGLLAGGSDLRLVAKRRHLLQGTRRIAINEGDPWRWWVDAPLYFRPEARGLLLCPCDEEIQTAPVSGMPVPPDPAVAGRLAEILSDLAPELLDLRIQNLWAGLRTFTEDHRFAIGPDPAAPDLFWVAGLAGHGMTTGLAVGELAAELLDREDRHPDFDPARLV